MGKKEQPCLPEEQKPCNNEDPPPAYEDTSASTSRNLKSVATEEGLVGDSEASAATAESETPIKIKGVPLHLSDKATKTRFFRMVYLTLVVEGCIISAIIAGCLYFPLVRNGFDDMSKFLFWLVWITALSLSSAIGGLNKFARLDPMNLFLAFTITAASGGLLGSLSAYFDTVKILVSVGDIVGICVCLVIYSFIPKCQLTPNLTLVLCWILTAIGYGLQCICYAPLQAVWISSGPLLFTSYFCIASNFVVKNYEELHIDKCLKSNEIIFGTTSIQMLIVNVVRSFLVKCLPCCRPCAQCEDNC